MTAKRQATEAMRELSERRKPLMAKVELAPSR
jgi:hypothetical protein